MASIPLAPVTIWFSIITRDRNTFKESRFVAVRFLHHLTLHVRIGSHAVPWEKNTHARVGEHFRYAVHRALFPIASADADKTIERPVDLKVLSTAHGRCV